MKALCIALLAVGCVPESQTAVVPEPVFAVDVNRDYYAALKNRVYDRWQPSRIWKKLSRAVTTPFAASTIVIVVQVDVSTAGDVQSVAVTRGSGVPELDDEAIRAFEASSPFPPPPVEVVRAGVLTFPFTFNFEVPVKW